MPLKSHLLHRLTRAVHKMRQFPEHDCGTDAILDELQQQSVQRAKSARRQKAQQRRTKTLSKLSSPQLKPMASS
jgi:hypothetical protein